MTRSGNRVITQNHTRISTTLEIYTDTDEQARRDALTRLQNLLGDTQN
jgi:hypothetical protein